MSVAAPKNGGRFRLPAFWQLLRRGNRRRRELVVPFFVLLVRSLGAAILVLTVRSPQSMRRYILGAFLSILACWTIVVAYITLTPPSYSSRWTFILPTSSSGTSLNLESIGTAQTISSSPFGSSTLSPKVIYKEIISSEQVRLAAARKLGMELGAFGSSTRLRCC